MELFSGLDPDLSLQISPPNSRPPPSAWRSKADERETMELGLWRRPQAASTADSPSATAAAAAVAAGGKASPPYGCAATASDPIRGIPIYHHPPLSFPFLPLHNQHHQNLLQSDSFLSSNPSLSGLPRSRYLPARFPAKRIMRAPRMRWTSTLHARFVRAVGLLGGHESTPIDLANYILIFLYNFIFHLTNICVQYKLIHMHVIFFILFDYFDIIIFFLWNQFRGNTKVCS